MMSKVRKKITAFTVMEALIVLALMSILTAFFFRTLNRLGEQVKNETIIKSELNNWFAFRANLFSEFDEADSLETKKDEAILYSKQRKIRYKIQDGLLIREENERAISTGIEMNAIDLNEKKQTVFHFDWKGEDMALLFSCQPSLKNRINQYFSQQTWE